MRIRIIIIFMIFSLASCGGGGDGSDSSDNGTPPVPPETQTAIVLAANDLGMHCMDKEFSVFSILPPFNVMNAQVVKHDSSGRPYIADDSEVAVFYEEVADPSGSINGSSIGKTDFWQYANSLFGTNLEDGKGLTGLYMPGDNPLEKGPQPMEFSLAKNLFSAEGIPITPMDDDNHMNPYPLMRILALDRSTDENLGHLDVVVPVATETDCQTCHRTGGIAAEDAAVTWSTNGDLEIQSKINVLKLHDLEIGTHLEASQPVLCAQCHYSPALDLAGTGPSGDQSGHPTFSNVMHEYHGDLLHDNGSPVFPQNMTVDDTCYQCHPGKITQCQRGAMKTGGMDCNDCHGSMQAVGGKFPLLTGGSIDGTNDGNPRRPWMDLPRCQSCHTGDAMNHLSGPDLQPDPDAVFRLRQAYKTGDASASPLVATNQRFAENTNTLYRFSKGHGGIGCQGCHGSTHAEWPDADPASNDNLASQSLQGYAGVLMECTTCHGAGSLARTVNGPHGLHNINHSAWYDDGHESFYENNKNHCKSCHGTDLRGTVLSRASTARSFRVEDNKVVGYAKGDFVRCNDCHGIPEL